VSTTKLLYGSNNQIIGVTLNSLSNNSSRQSDSISNTTNVFLDALVFVNNPESSLRSELGAWHSNSRHSSSESQRTPIG
jgi:hypothetical protein